MYFCCMENEVNESFEILLAACRTADSNLAVAYKQLRDLLERLCRAQMQDESLQMTDPVSYTHLTLPTICSV